jgi:uncharacterized protein YajQ (UPF0234 family)
MRPVSIQITSLKQWARQNNLSEALHQIKTELLKKPFSSTSNRQLNEIHRMRKIQNAIESATKALKREDMKETLESLGVLEQESNGTASLQSGSLEKLQSLTRELREELAKRLYLEGYALAISAPEEASDRWTMALSCLGENNPVRKDIERRIDRLKTSGYLLNETEDIADKPIRLQSEQVLHKELQHETLYPSRE